MKEKTVRQRIRLAVGGRPDVVLLSNPSGVGVVGKIESFRQGAEYTVVHQPRYIAFGLGAQPGGRGGGFPDLIGWRTIEVTPEMVGTKIAVFVGIEVKAPGKKPREDQARILQVLRDAGALAGCATSIEEAVDIVEDI